MSQAGHAAGKRWVTIAPADAIAEEEMLAVDAEGARIALYRAGGCVYATDDLCTHANAALTDGWLEGCIVECPLHGGRFDVTTGKGLGPPIDCDLKTYEVRVAGTDIQVGLDADATTSTTT
jgi:nitrite reductase/ring-hydroxylating ferredoxin subunit